ncbi:hypothetical protein [Roseivirga sp. 4D4]|uniref:hypothetical protein n=1 Tax=Roseivirga sp. 4D4 TaxID=1889784 RepID=UPI001112EA85|nr:hypothetical protein [Roseivirga sp. 4D4]
MKDILRMLAVLVLGFLLLSYARKQTVPIATPSEIEVTRTIEVAMNSLETLERKMATTYSSNTDSLIKTRKKDLNLAALSVENAGNAELLVLQQDCQEINQWIEATLKSLDSLGLVRKINAGGKIK